MLIDDSILDAILSEAGASLDVMDRRKVYEKTF